MRLDWFSASCPLVLRGERLVQTGGVQDVARVERQVRRLGGAEQEDRQGEKKVGGTRKDLGGSLLTLYPSWK